MAAGGRRRALAAAVLAVTLTACSGGADDRASRWLEEQPRVVAGSVTTSPADLGVEGSAPRVGVRLAEGSAADDIQRLGRSVRADQPALAAAGGVLVTVDGLSVVVGHGSTEEDAAAARLLDAVRRTLGPTGVRQLDPDQPSLVTSDRVTLEVATGHAATLARRLTASRSPLAQAAPGGGQDRLLVLRSPGEPSTATLALGTSPDAATARSAARVWAALDRAGVPVSSLSEGVVGLAGTDARGWAGAVRAGEAAGGRDVALRGQVGSTDLSTVLGRGLEDVADLPSAAGLPSSLRLAAVDAQPGRVVATLRPHTEPLDLADVSDARDWPLSRRVDAYVLWSGAGADARHVSWRADAAPPSQWPTSP